MEKGAGIKASIFGIFVLALIIGGFIMVKRTSNTEEKTKEEVKEEYKDIRIDNTKDYIYYENKDEENYIDELDIEFKDVVINFKETTGIEETLNKENKEFKDTLKYDEEETHFDGLIYAKYSKYEIYTYLDYVSLVVKYYEFDVDNEESGGLPVYLDSSAYVFNKNTGKLYTDEELLTEFELDSDKMYEMIKDTIDGEDLVREEEELDSNATINAIKDPTLYVDKVGRLTVSVLVKSDKLDYNEDIILN